MPTQNQLLVFLSISVLLFAYFLGQYQLFKMQEETEQRVLLPTNVRPTHYALTITPDLVNFTFTGSEIISLNINENTKTITLHAHDIDIKSAKLVNLALKSSQNHKAANIQYDSQRQTATLTFQQEFAAKTTATLHIEYTGVMNDKMNGFYRSSYKDHDGKTRYMASTQFEATEARRAFPSWDEPAIKATFDITLIVPSELTALSNMNVVSETRRGDGTKEVKFAKTRIMSTYLVAFVVGDLGYIEASTTGIHNGGKPVLVRVYASKGDEQHGEFALSVAKKALEYFAEVFGIPYPLTKCDMVAIPDFEAGAMENWGLITYRTTAILFNNKESDIRFKQRIAYTVSHEIAHQWFGNLVTMEWWDHLWLNEGFATWVGYLAVDKLFPDWGIWDQYINEGFQRGLSLDSLMSSHPIEVPVKDSCEIHQIFDAISYYKGANVIRMLSTFLGEDVFLAGVRRYLERHKFGNASTDNLWTALEEESHNEVSRFMSIWTKKTGYPVLSVDELEDNKLKIRQCRFLSTGVVSPEDDDTIWWVPLSVDFGPSQNPASSVILTQKEMTLVMPENCDFYQINARKTGVFRVNYTPERLFKLGQAVKENLVSIADRVGIMADAGALASSGYGKTSGLLNFIKEFENEEKYIVWCEISARLSKLRSVWFEQPEPIYQGLLKFQRQLVSKLVTKLGWNFSEDEDYMTTMLRVLVIKMAGKADDSETVKEAHRKFHAFTRRNEESALHANIRSAVFEIVLSHGGGNEEYDAILKFYNENRPADQKISALMGLGFVSRDDLIQRTLKFSTSDEVRNQDLIYIFNALQANRNSRRALWNYVKENWYMLHDRYAKSLALFDSIVKFSIDSFSSEDDIKDIERFFSNKNCKEFERALHQSIETVRANAAWLSRDKQDVEDWLRANGYIDL